MEWVVVFFPNKRDVFIDGRRSGETEVKLIVSTGRHRFSLGVPRNYKPLHKDVTVKNTTVLTPQSIAFDPA